ncbi:hypothetical protein EG867_16690, partial [Enterococcus faecalis]
SIARDTELHNALTIGTPANGLSLNVQELSLALASATTTGALSSGDWSTFNSKQNALTFGNITGTTNQVSVSGGTGAVIGTGVSLSLPQDINSTATPTFGGLTLNGNQTLNGTLAIQDATDTYYTTFQGGTQTGNITYTLPTGNTNGLLRNTAGVLSWDTNTYLTANQTITLTGDVT